MLYACDVSWWVTRQGCPGFLGLKVSQDPGATKRFPEIRLVVCARTGEDLILDRIGHVGWGGNSGFHAINIAAQVGAARIILVGFDMRVDHGLHWHGKHVTGLNNPSRPNVERWRRTIDRAAPVLADAGIEVVNASPISALLNYPKMALSEALDAEDHHHDRRAAGHGGAGEAQREDRLGRGG